MKKNNIIHFLTKSEILKKYKRIIESKYARTSIIYKYNQNELLKIFYNNRDYEKEKYKLYCDLNLSNFATPKKLVYISGKLYGYIMDKKEGIMLDFIDNSTKIRDIFKNLDMIDENINQLSYNNLMLVDLHEQNILYDSNNQIVNIIDMDDYFFNNILTSIYEVLYINYKFFYRSFLNILISENNNCQLDISNKKYKELCNIIEQELDKENFNSSYIFNLLIDEYENMVNKEVITLNDFRDSSKKLLK